MKVSHLESFRVALLFICQGSFCSIPMLYLSGNFLDATKRRRRDLNPRAAINDLHPFQGCPFSLLGTSPKRADKMLNYGEEISLSPQRREWDSNPRALADKRFSRPPRYDHFDISPYVRFSVSAKIILTKKD